MMKRSTKTNRRSWPLLGCLGLLGLASLSPLPVQANPPAGTGAWMKTFDDEFNESSLDGSKWSVGWSWLWPDGSFGGYNDHTNFHGDKAGYPAYNVTLDGNGLSLRSAAETYKDDQGDTKQYTSGAITTDGHYWQKYGYYEASMMVVTTQGLDSGFWLVPRDHDTGVTTGMTELDISEVPAAPYYNGGIDYSGDVDFTSVHTVLNGTYSTDIQPYGNGALFEAAPHTFGLDWEPAPGANPKTGTASFYLDGNFIRTSTYSITKDRPMYMIVSNELADDADAGGGNWYGAAENGNYNPPTGIFAHARWVKTWQKVAKLVPYKGPHAVPGTIQAEDYNTGGQGLAYNTPVNAGNAGYRTDNNGDVRTSTTGSNGYAAGWSAPGTWYSYTVNVTTTGPYTATFQVASAGPGGTFHLEDEKGRSLTSSLTAPNTTPAQGNPWDNWQPVTSPVFSLSAGKHTLRFVEDTYSPAGPWVCDFDCFTVSAHA